MDKDIDSVFIRLRDELIEARFAYDTGDDAGRLGAMLAVAAATNFLKEMGVPKPKAEWAARLELGVDRPDSKALPSRLRHA